MEYSLGELLRPFALSERERAVFERLVEVGMQAASAIAAKCEMPRNTVRGVLDKLVKEGLVIRTRRANTQLYAAERPETLIRLLLQRKESLADEIESQIAAIKLHGAALDRGTRNPGRPRVTFYDGHRGLTKVYEDTLSARSGLRSWASFDANQEALPRYFNSYYKRRARKGISMKSIHPDSVMARKHTSNNRAFLRRSVLAPKGKFKIGPEVQVYDNKVNIVSWKDKLGIIIESREIADAMISIFELAYETARRCYGERL